MRKWFVLLAFGIAALSSASPAAPVPAFTFAGGTANSGQFFTYGFVFTPTTTIAVDSLGFFDQDANGLGTGHHAAIWTTGGVLLASTIVTTGNSTLSGPVVNGGQFRYSTIATLLLAAGVPYVFGVSIESGPDVWYAGGSNLSASPLVNVSATGVYSPGTFVVPGLTIGNTYAAGSFTAQAVPEPMSAALVGLGAIAFVGGRRRKGRARRRPEHPAHE